MSRNLSNFGGLHLIYFRGLSKDLHDLVLYTDFSGHFFGAFVIFIVNRLSSIEVVTFYLQIEYAVVKLTVLYSAYFSNKQASICQT